VEKSRLSLQKACCFSGLAEGSPKCMYFSNGAGQDVAIKGAKSGVFFSWGACARRGLFDGRDDTGVTSKPLGKVTVTKRPRRRAEAPLLRGGIVTKPARGNQLMRLMYFP
jgi:hypothetical protein